MNEPDWLNGCAAYAAVKPGKECKDCLYQRKLFGYVVENGKWVKKNDKQS